MNIGVLFFITVYFGCLPERGASKIGKLYSILHTAAYDTQ
jgi:hypothetical protein